MSEDDNKLISELGEVENQLKGNTLLVYWYMLRCMKPLGAREIQRAVRLSSSSLALHHLNKLIELKLVGKDQFGSFIIIKAVRPGLLGFFIGSGRMFIPRFVLYAFFNTGLLISCTILFSSRLDAVSIILLASLVVTTLVFWFETFKMWKTQPL
ncbi:MAG: hypothetical protein P1Q69_13985 [Candidatus Thorarchaeota archaeon]|nr:hypothetical protein [Candidatus Thorarchaeota archaeon]